MTAAMVAEPLDTLRTGYTIAQVLCMQAKSIADLRPGEDVGCGGYIIDGWPATLSHAYMLEFLLEGPACKETVPEGTTLDQFMAMTTDKKKGWRYVITHDYIYFHSRFDTFTICPP